MLAPITLINVAAQRQTGLPAEWIQSDIVRVGRTRAANPPFLEPDMRGLEQYLEPQFERRSWNQTHKAGRSIGRGFRRVTGSGHLLVDRIF